MNSLFVLRKIMIKILPAFTEHFVLPYSKEKRNGMVRKMAMNNNWYETSEDLLMPLPLTENQIEQLSTEDLTEEMVDQTLRLLYPRIALPQNTNVTVIPIIPGITLFGYIRFFHASPVNQRVDIYVNGRKIASNLSYRSFTEYLKVFPGYYRVAVFVAGTTTNPLVVSRINVIPNRIYTAAIIGLGTDLDIQMINDNRRVLENDRAYFRLVQFSPNAPVLDVYWDDRLILSELEYQEVSRYLGVTPGEYNLKFTSTMTDDVILENPSVILEGGKAYTIYVVGDITSRTGLQVVIPLEGTTYLEF